MNATPTHLNPVNAIQPAASGKQQDAASPDTPFSQVLSSEMAQSRGGSEAKEDRDAKAVTEVASKPGDSTKADAASKGKAGDADETARDPLDPLLAGSTPAIPDVPVLATQPDLKPVTASMDDASAEQPAAVGADTLLATMGTTAPTATEPGKGRAPLVPQVAQATDKATDAQKTNSALPKADLQAATGALNTSTHSSTDASTLATAFSEKLAAARQTDTAMTAERGADLMSNPTLRPAPHAPLGVQDIPPGIDPLTANKLAPSVGTTAWGQALGEKVVWMAAGAQQTASLTLNPPNLGPLQIVLNVTNDQATASFFSAQPEVRQALESAFPRLREMMNEAGIQLGEATVSAETPRQHDTPERQAQRLAPQFIGADDAAIPPGLQTVPVSVQQSGRGLIDTFA